MVKKSITIEKVRIKNFKSISDSNDIYMDKNITILAGKNEAGKTSILEALLQFNTNISISKDAIPIQDDKALPEIIVTFNVAKNVVQEIMDSLEITSYVTKNIYEITLIKYFPNAYELYADEIFTIDFYEKVTDDYLNKLESEYKKFQKLNIEKINLNIEANDIEFSIENLDQIKNNFDLLYAKLKPHIPNLPKEDDFNYGDFFKLNISMLKKLSDKEYYRKLFMDEFREKIPNFILFNSFEDILPHIVPLSEIENNEWIKDLAIISDLDTSIIASDDDRSKQTHKKNLNLKISNDYKNFWEQDLSQIVIDWDNEKLMIWIEENDHFYEPQNRSKGKQWHLAFYIKVTARAIEGKQNVILIDEPGLYLHARAQRDILKKLEDSSIHASIIFTTHSPYLLEPEKFERIRLVLKDDNKGSYVENKIHKVSDKETLTPILTAIGLD